MTEIEKQLKRLEILVQKVNENLSFSTTHPVLDPSNMDFTKNITYVPYTQTGDITFVFPEDGKDGRIHKLYFTSNGDAINIPSEFKETLGLFSEIVSTPGIYEISFTYFNDKTDKEIWIDIPNAVTTPTVDLTSLFQGIFEMKETGDFTFHSGVNIATCLNKSIHASAFSDLVVTAEANSPVYDSGNKQATFNGADQTFDYQMEGASTIIWFGAKLNGYISLSTRNSIGQPFTASSGDRTINWGNHTGAYANETLGILGSGAINDTPNTTPTYNYFLIKVQNGQSPIIYLNGTLGNIISPGTTLTGHTIEFQLGFAPSFNEWFTGGMKGYIIRAGDLTGQEIIDANTYLNNL